MKNKSIIELSLLLSVLICIFFYISLRLIDANGIVAIGVIFSILVSSFLSWLLLISAINFFLQQNKEA